MLSLLRHFGEIDASRDRRRDNHLVRAGHNFRFCNRRLVAREAGVGPRTGRAKMLDHQTGRPNAPHFSLLRGESSLLPVTGSLHALHR
jgi:hypothetical protein